MPTATAASVNLRSPSRESENQPVTFVPDIPTLEFGTEIPVILETAEAAGDLEPLEGEGLPTYRRANCGAIDDTTCYEFCYRGDCFVYGDDDERVQRFIESVDEMRDQFDKLNLARIEEGSNIWETAGTCLKSIGAGMGAAGTIAAIVVAADPTGIAKVLAIGAAAGAALAGVAGCGSAVVGTGADRETQEDIVRDFGEATNDAIFEFNDLQHQPPEE